MVSNSFQWNGDEITKIRVELLTITTEAIVGNPQLITLWWILSTHHEEQKAITAMNGRRSWVTDDVFKLSFYNNFHILQYYQMPGTRTGGILVNVLLSSVDPIIISGKETFSRHDISNWQIAHLALNNNLSLTQIPGCPDVNMTPVL